LSERKGVILVSLAAIFFGTEAIFSKLAYASGVNYLSTITFRAVFSSILLLGILFAIGQNLKVPKSMYRLLGLLAVLFTIIGSCLFKAIEILPASLAVLFFYSFPAFTGLFDYLIKGEKLSRQKIFALLISFCGIFLLQFNSVGTIPVMGIVYAVGAALVNSLFMVLSPIVLKEVHELTVTSWMLMCSAIFYLIVGGFTGSLSYNLSLPGWSYLVLLALISTSAANITLIYGLGAIGSTTAAIVQTLEPVVTATLAFIVFGERLQGWQVFGAVLVIIAVLIPQLRENLKPKQEPSTGSLQ
jgi:drug/metabolite transporter (DMT)-like permease